MLVGYHREHWEQLVWNDVADIEHFRGTGVKFVRLQMRVASGCWRNAIAGRTAFEVAR
jgi:hypothetical protein